MADLSAMKLTVIPDLHARLDEAGQAEVAGQVTLRWESGRELVVPIRFPVEPLPPTEPVAG